MNTQEHVTILEIDLNALRSNLKFLRAHIAADTKFMAVVKANSYGSDAIKIAQALQQEKVDYLAVAYTHEGVLLRDNGITLPILVLHPQPASFNTIIDRCLEPGLYSNRTLDAFVKIAQDKNQKDYPIHIKFNSGLNRIGFGQKEATTIGVQLKNETSVKVVSAFSHLAASEDLGEKAFTLGQIDAFAKAVSHFENALKKTVWKHQSNTSAILNFPEAHWDMVRSGIGLYGFGNDTRFSNKLKPIATLTSSISQIQTLEPGESLGYNRGYIATGKTKTATIPMGHADGLNRIYGHGKGYVWINNQKAPILGNVCMDMIMVDITHIDCQEGDEIIVFSPKHPAAQLAESASTISYELITSINLRIHRRFIG